MTVVSGEQEPTVQRGVELLMALFRQAAGLAVEVQRQTGLAPTDVRALQAMDLLAGPAAQVGSGMQAGVTVNRLGTELGVSSGAASMLVDRLEQAGLVHRERDATDRRRVLVVPTPHAFTVGATALQPQLERFLQALEQRTRPDLEIILAFLDDLLDPTADPQDPAGR